MKERIYEDIISTWDLAVLIPSAQLHDLGKIGIKDNILNKPGRFTPEEFEQMKTHTTIGVKVIERIITDSMQHASLKETGKKFLTHAKLFAGTHHERWNGTGYPEGLKGEEIPLEGRLMAVADVYDAIISERPYKAAMSTKEAETIILTGKGAHFDPILVDVFETMTDKFAQIAAEYR
jgi:putative two-component system response regulator